MSALLLLFAGLQASQVNPIQDDRCAVTVEVLQIGGLVADRLVPVYLLDSAGKVVLETTNRGGKARFCDFGFGRHTIQVGEADRCGAAKILNVVFDHKSEQRFQAVLNSCAGEGIQFILGGCPLELRVVNESGQPVPHPIARREGFAQQGTRTGYIPFSIPDRTTATVRVSAEGYEDGSIVRECPRLKLYQEVVVLKAK